MIDGVIKEVLEEEGAAVLWAYVSSTGRREEDRHRAAMLWAAHAGVRESWDEAMADRRILDLVKQRLEKVPVSSNVP